jgi:hypothetical protein
MAHAGFRLAQSNVKGLRGINRTSRTLFGWRAVEDLINSILSGTSWLHAVRSFMGTLNVFDLPSHVFSIAVVFSSAALVILNRFTGDVGYATVPLNYLALLFGALLANWWLRDIRTPFEPTLQAPIVFAIAGMTAAGLFMMFVLRKQ